jgi:hypothetical protein
MAVSEFGAFLVVTIFVKLSANILLTPAGSDIDQRPLLPNQPPSPLSSVAVSTEQVNYKLSFIHIISLSLLMLGNAISSEARNVPLCNFSSYFGYLRCWIQVFGLLFNFLISSYFLNFCQLIKYK